MDINELKDRISDWEKELKDLKARASKSTGSTKDKIEDQIRKVQSKVDDAKEKYRDLKEKGEDLLDKGKNILGKFKK